MTPKRVFVLEIDAERAAALDYIRRAPGDLVVEVKPKTRTDDQSRRFHAMVRDIARSGLKWAGKRRSDQEWKVLLVSAHAVAAGEPGEVLPGIEGEFVAIRESTALMSVGRGSSLIEYVRSFGDLHGVEWSGPERESA